MIDFLDEKPDKAEDCSSKKKYGGYCCLVKSKGKNDCVGFGPNECKYIVDLVKYRNIGENVILMMTQKTAVNIKIFQLIVNHTILSLVH